MKKLILSAACLLFTLFAAAQNAAIDKLFEKYSGREGFTSVVISSKMFSLFSEMETSDPDFDNLVRGLKSIRILATDEATPATEGVNFYKEVMSLLPANQYEELMVVKEKDQDVKILIREEKDEIVELLIVVGGKDDNAVISIQGIIDLKTISKLSQSMNIQGLENLEKIDEK